MRRTVPALISLLLACPLLMTLQAQTAPRAKAPAKSGAQQRAVVFVVEKWENGETLIDPIVLLGGGGRFTAPPNGGDDVADAESYRRFVSEYYRPQRQYRMLFGGGEVGSVSVVQAIEPGCVSNTASVTAQGSVKLGGEVRALATDSGALGRESHTRRAPTEAERASAHALARAAYKQRRVPDALVKKMETINLTAVDLERDGKAELIGSFSAVAGDYTQHALFMIFELKGVSYRPAHTWYHAGAEAEAQTRRLVDVLDLDGDGTAEVLVMGSYYESHDYFIYQKQRAQWRNVYQGGGGGC
ncbi:MAG: hypothetical protein ACRD9R_02225 [Pyrinomonadaceae bacterium]